MSIRNKHRIIWRCDVRAKSICSVRILPEPTRLDNVVLFRSLATNTQTCSLEIPLFEAEPPRFLDLRFIQHQPRTLT